MRRRLLFLPAVVLGWLALLAAFIPIPLGAPLMPSSVVTLEGRTFTAVLGRSEVDGAGLRVSGMDVDLGALQVRALDALDAERHPILRYRFEDFPRTLELVLVFRGEGDAEARTVTIPTVVSGRGTVDLSAIPGWRGRIQEIGFAQYPGAQSVPPGSAFRPFVLRDAQLWSSSWSGALAARMQDWFGARSWALMSLSALGPDAALPPGRSLVLMMIIGMTATVLLGAWLLGWRSAKLGRMALIAAVVAWLVLDLRWLHGLHARHAATRDAYADLPVAERQRRFPDQTVFDSAQMLRKVLAHESSDTRIFVDAGSDFERARLMYHLLPMNVAPMNMIGVPIALRQEGAVVVLYAYPHLPFDPADSTLVLAGERFPVNELFDLGPLRVYRVKAPTP
jgi:hypothetical protein